MWPAHTLRWPQTHDTGPGAVYPVLQLHWGKPEATDHRCFERLSTRSGHRGPLSQEHITALIAGA